MIKSILLVGLGGGIGSIFRYLTSVFIHRQAQPVFPLATFMVNILGCLILGGIMGLLERHQVSNQELRLLFITGFCGGYTTFSAFAAENIRLLQTGHLLTAALYITISVLTGLSGVWFGYLLTR